MIDSKLLLKRHIMNLILGKDSGYYITEEQMPLVDYYLNIQFHFALLEQAGVYKIIFDNNTWYIGKTKNIVKRIWEHLQKGKSNFEFVEIKQYHIDNNIPFTVLKLSDNEKDEVKLIHLHLSIDNNYCYNKEHNTRI
jgi:hypothetical protein